MALPTKIRTWKYQVNASISGGATQTAAAQNLLYAIKQAIVGAGIWTDDEGVAASAPTGWTVAGSSNSSASGMDATDRWTSAASVVGATAAPHSWIVLRHATLGDVLIDCSTTLSAAPNATISWSKQGFGTAAGGSDGSTSTAPTAANSVSLVAAAALGSPSGGAVSTRLHVMHSSAGLHIVGCRNGWPVLLAQFTDVTASALDGSQWPTQVAVRWGAVGTPAPSGATGVADTYSTSFFGRGASANLTFSPLTWGRAGGDTPLSADAAHGVTGDLPILPVGLYCTTGAAEGIYAFVPDVWLTTNGARNFGFPSDSAAEWQAFANTILPWNKSTALLS